MLQVKLETPTKKNSFEIALTKGKTAIVDPVRSLEILEYSWVAIKCNFRWYAYAWKFKDGRIARVAMHRLIAKTPPGEICHHLNKNSLDNRRSNLLNMTHRHHKQLHGIRRFGRKNKNKTTIKNKRKTT